MKQIIKINLISVPLDIGIIIALYYLGWFNIYTVILDIVITWGIIHFCSYRYLHKPLYDMAEFVENLDPGHITDEDISRFKSLHISDVYSIGNLSDNIVDLLTELKRGGEMIRCLDYESSHDELTSLCNRNKLDKNVDYYIRTASSIAVIFLDINNLKRMNDEFGHDDGDRLLIRVANKLMDWKEYGDVYRIGGDEFVIVLLNDQTKDVQSRFASWYQSLKPFNDYSSDGFKCELAYGISVYDGKNVDFDFLLNDADIKMYHMKSQLKAG